LASSADHLSGGRPRIDDVSPQSPEERERRLAEGRAASANPLVRARRGHSPLEVVKRVVVGVYTDGFIHAGNLAYLSLLTLFPFFIVAAAVAQIFGHSEDGARTVTSFLHTLPGDVADILRQPIADVLHARSGSLLWLGALIGLWTVGSFIETIRDIVRRAYGVTIRKAFWQYRLGSVLIIVSSVVLAMVAFVVQGAITAVEQLIYRLVPRLAELGPLLGMSRLVPGTILFVAFYMLFYTLTPTKYRYSGCLKWPGALLVAVWWVGTTALLPIALAQLGGYGRTYGSLAGVVIALLFFWFVGFGIVIGAHLNAALAETDAPAVKEAPTETIGRGA
jgi:membrane protein